MVPETHTDKSDHIARSQIQFGVSVNLIVHCFPFDSML